MQSVEVAVLGLGGVRLFLRRRQEIASSAAVERSRSSEEVSLTISPRKTGVFYPLSLTAGVPVGPLGSSGDGKFRGG